MGIKVSVDFDGSGISRKLGGISENSKLGKFLASEAASGMDRYVPKRQSVLRGSVKTDVPFEVSYNTPYAHYIWEGKSKNGAALKYTEPGAVSHWDKHYAKSHGRELAKAAEEFIKRSL